MSRSLFLLVALSLAAASFGSRAVARPTPADAQDALNAVDGFELTRLDPTTALLTYHAAQETLCNGHPVPSPVWVSSLYVLRGHRWLNAMYQQTQAL